MTTDITYDMTSEMISDIISDIISYMTSEYKPPVKFQNSKSPPSNIFKNIGIQT
jgi:hypothetical protein